VSDAAVTIEGAEPSGLATMLATLIEQNLERDPARRALLDRPGAVSIVATDAEVAVTLRLGGGRVVAADGVDPAASVVIRTDSARLLALTSAPRRWGLPDVLRPEGRAVVRDLLRGDLRIRGLVAHQGLIARVTGLLAVAPG
jgi:hypothetical protein